MNTAKNDNWTACLDDVSDLLPFCTGTEAEVKVAARDHRNSDNAYIEDPEGNQFAWNRATMEWDEI